MCCSYSDLNFGVTFLEHGVHLVQGCRMFWEIEPNFPASFLWSQYPNA